jgi:hypothetical protein
MYGGFLAKNTICTLYIPMIVWFCPTLFVKRHPLNFTAQGNCIIVVAATALWLKGFYGSIGLHIVVFLCVRAYKKVA